MGDQAQQDDSHVLSEKQTNTDDSKLSTTAAMVADPQFPLPMLDENVSTLRYIQSFTVLGIILAAGVFGAWFLETSMLQTSQPVVVLSGVFAVVLGALFFTGTVWIDWWELVLGYWWLSLPLGAAAGLVLVMNQEVNSGLEEVT